MPRDRSDEVWADVLEGIQTVRTAGPQGACSFQQYSGCFYCWAPQQLYARWVPCEDGFAQLSRGDCTYGDVLSTFLGFCFAANFVDLDARREAVAIVRKCGVWVADGIEL